MHKLESGPALNSTDLGRANGSAEKHAHLQKASARAHEEVTTVSREHDRRARGVDALVPELDGGRAQPLPRVAQVLREVLHQGRLGRRPAVVRLSLLDPLVAVVALAPGHFSAL